MTYFSFILPKLSITIYFRKVARSRFQSIVTTWSCTDVLSPCAIVNCGVRMHAVLQILTDVMFRLIFYICLYYCSSQYFHIWFKTEWSTTKIQPHRWLSYSISFSKSNLHYFQNLPLHDQKLNHSTIFSSPLHLTNSTSLSTHTSLSNTTFTKDHIHQSFYLLRKLILLKNGDLFWNDK